MANKTWDKEREAFQKAIKEVRRKSDLTQVGLSERLGRPQSYVSKYENGERRLDFVETVEVCAACSVSIANFNKTYQKNL